MSCRGSHLREAGTWAQATELFIRALIYNNETSLNKLKGQGRGVSKHWPKEKNKLLFTKDAQAQVQTCHVIREAAYQQISKRQLQRSRTGVIAHGRPRYQLLSMRSWLLLDTELALCKEL